MERCPPGWDRTSHVTNARIHQPFVCVPHFSVYKPSHIELLTSPKCARISSSQKTRTLAHSLAFFYPVPRLPLPFFFTKDTCFELEMRSRCFQLPGDWTKNRLFQYGNDFFSLITLCSPFIYLPLTGKTKEFSCCVKWTNLIYAVWNFFLPFQFNENPNISK